MSVLFYGMALIFIAFLIHLCFWKIHLPKNQTKALLYIFLCTFLSGVSILLNFSNKIAFFGISSPRTYYENIQISFLFISLTLAYISTYSALEVDSPSLVMIVNIAEADTGGLEKNIFEQKMNNNILVLPRIRNLVASKMVELDNGVYKLTLRSLLIVQIFIAYRKLLKRSHKGG